MSENTLDGARGGLSGLGLSEYENNLVNRAIRRKKVFLILSLVSVVIGVGLSLFYFWQAQTNPDFQTGIHVVLVILILLNGRQNMRQYKYAGILETVMPGQRS